MFSNRIGRITRDYYIDEDFAKKNNADMGFGPNDLAYSLANNVDGYVAVPNRSCAKGDRITSGNGLSVVIAGQCKPTKHEEWYPEEEGQP